MLEFRIRAIGYRVKVRARVRDSWYENVRVRIVWKPYATRTGL